ncbi:hypothetical protein [Hyella patelloides]|nr:hypothetical protein [Hyella patelloides]
MNNSLKSDRHADRVWIKIIAEKFNRSMAVLKLGNTDSKNQERWFKSSYQNDVFGSNFSKYIVISNLG